MQVIHISNKLKKNNAFWLIIAALLVEALPSSRLFEFDIEGIGLTIDIGLL